MSHRSAHHHISSAEDEPLPPYSVFEPVATESGSHSEVPAIIEPSWHLLYPALAQEPNSITVEPTDMTAVTNASDTRAVQLLEPSSSISLTLEGMKSVQINVRVDSEHKYNGLVYIEARFSHKLPLLLERGQVPVQVSSCLVSETNRVQIDFTATARFGSMREITGELELVLPQNADTVIPELVFRLPPCSNLELANIASNVVNLIDVATISGCVSVEDVDVGRMRVAIGDGHIRASGIAVSHGSAEFIAMTGSIQVHDCAVPGGNIRVNSPGAMLKMENISAHKILIQSSQATTCIYNAEADFVSVESDSGLLTLNNIAARVLKVKADTSPVTGSWIIGESIDIAVVSAIIQGKLAFRGDSVRAYIGTTEWPVRLAISENYSGSFDISAVNSVVNFCLADAALNEGQTRRRGAVGEGTHMLHVESSNAPIVITTH